MGIFSPNGMSYSEPLDIENMSYLEAKYDNPFEDGMRIYAESENNYNNIMKAIAIDELNVLESTGSEMIYEAGALKSFFGKMKEFFVNLWEKIKGIFKKFFAKMNALILKDKDFVKKYKAAIIDVNIKGFKYEGFEFKHLDASIENPQNISEIKKLSDIKGISDKKALIEYKESLSEDALEKVIAEYRGKLVGGPKIEKEDFAEALFKYYRNGEDEKVELESININELLKEIGDTAVMKKNGERALKDIGDRITAIIKELENAEKEALKKVPSEDIETAKIGAYNATIKAYKECMGAAQLFTTAKLQAIKDQNRQAKAICVKLLTYKPKTESTGFIHTEGGSFLDSVVLR